MHRKPAIRHGGEDFGGGPRRRLQLLPKAVRKQLPNLRLGFGHNLLHQGARLQGLGHVVHAKQQRPHPAQR